MILKSTTLSTSVTIENVPSYANTVPYIVARFDDQTKKYWFYGAWTNKEEAEHVVNKLGDCALIFYNEKSENP